jgi:hypothetical protein
MVIGRGIYYSVYIYYIGFSNVSATSWTSVMCQLHRDLQQCVSYIMAVSNVSATS